jgi:hypothetical protein
MALSPRKASSSVKTVEDGIELELLGNRWQPWRDPEEELLSGPENRPFLLTHASIMSSAMILIIVVQAMCISKVILSLSLSADITDPYNS